MTEKPHPGKVRVGAIIGVILAILAAIYFYFVLFPRLFPVSKSTTENKEAAATRFVSPDNG